MDTHKNAIIPAITFDGCRYRIFELREPSEEYDCYINRTRFDDYQEFLKDVKGIVTREAYEQQRIIV